MKYLSFLIMGGALLSASCSAQNKTSKDFTKLSGGLEYKTVVSGDGTKTPKQGDIAEMNVIMKFGDSTVFNTNKMNGNKPVKQGITKPRFEGGLMNGLLLMKAGDSTIFRQNLDTFLSFRHQPRPAWASDVTYVTWSIKLVNLMTKEESDAAMAKAAEAQKSIDDSIILNYLKEHQISNYKKTATGLYYVVIKQGSGISPKSGQQVTVNYTGKMLSGEAFDSNVDPKFKHVKPFVFPLGQGRVIKGWDEGVALMKKGENATFYLPSHLAYGQRGAGQKIPPNTVLVFDIELVSFE